MRIYRLAGYSASVVPDVGFDNPNPILDNFPFMADLENFFSEVSSLVNAELDWLIPAQGDEPRRLRDAIRWSLFAGGKHFRPALVFAAGRTLGAGDETLVRTAASVEMIHTYSLIHDDLPSMDDDDLRRGRETCHKKFDEATAILAGDALQVLSFQSIAEDVRLTAGKRVELISRLGRAAAKMVVGQQLDLEAEGEASITFEKVERIHRNKTGALIRFSAEAGAVIAGAGDDELSAISSYGESLGLLFQIKDDLLDLTRTTDQLGKTTGKDVASAKATYPSVFGIEETERLAREVHFEARTAIAILDRQSELLEQIADLMLSRNS
jgi:farnesyl diphosphate synthase